MRRVKNSLVEQLPEGFRYHPEFLSVAEEAGLIRTIETLPFRPFEFQGFTAKRRVVEYGWEYDFGSHKTAEAAPIPEYLRVVRERAARFAGLEAQSLVEAIV